MKTPLLGNAVARVLAFVVVTLGAPLLAQENDVEIDIEDSDLPPISIDDLRDGDIAVVDESLPSIEGKKFLSQQIHGDFSPGLTLTFHPLFQHDDGSIAERVSPYSRLGFENRAAVVSTKIVKDSFALTSSYDLRDSQLQNFYFDLTANEIYSFRLGLAPTIEGGWEGQLNRSTSILDSPYLRDISPFGGFGPLVEVSASTTDFGSLKVQAINDVQTANSEVAGYYSVKTKQPAFALAWSGKFGAIKPLIQFGSYDQNHSNYKQLGLKWRINRWELGYDYILDSRVIYDRNRGSASVDRIARLRVDVCMDLFENNRLLATFMDFGVVQGESDIFGNPPLSDGALKYTDNARTTAFSWSHLFSETFELYFLIYQTKAEFLDSATEELNDTESLWQRNVKVGLISQFF